MWPWARHPTLRLGGRRRWGRGRARLYGIEDGIRRQRRGRPAPGRTPPIPKQGRSAGLLGAAVERVVAGAVALPTAFHGSRRKGRAGDWSWALAVSVVETRAG